MLPKISDYMDTKVHTLTPEIAMLDAVSFLLDRGVTGAPVLDEAGALVGIITEKDCLKLLATGSDNDVPRGVVADYMTRDVTHIPPDMNIYFAAGMFLNNVVRRFPVVKDGKLVGAITRFDILRAIRDNVG